jgi:hypothetical protein
MLMFIEKGQNTHVSNDSLFGKIYSILQDPKVGEDEQARSRVFGWSSILL